MALNVNKISGLSCGVIINGLQPDPVLIPFYFPISNFQFRFPLVLH